MTERLSTTEIKRLNDLVSALRFHLNQWLVRLLSHGFALSRYPRLRRHVVAGSLHRAQLFRIRDCHHQSGYTKQCINISRAGLVGGLGCRLHDARRCWRLSRRDLGHNHWSSKLRSNGLMSCWWLGHVACFGRDVHDRFDGGRLSYRGDCDRRSRYGCFGMNQCRLRCRLLLVCR